GGRRGPALDGVATRLTRDQLIRQVLQGGGNMPAYGKNLTPAEVTALVAFMQTLRPKNEPRARTATMPAAPPRCGLVLFQCWPLDRWSLIPLVIAMGLYLRGWTLLRRARHGRVTVWTALAFLAALAAICVALSSPIDELARLLLQVHMTQHLVLTMVAPPLIWLGAPLGPTLRGLPQPIGVVAARLLSLRLVRRLTIISHPLATWSVFVVCLLVWHTPAAYELALGTHAWHHVQHACFFAAGLLFWWPVIQPWPSRPAWPRWTMIPYLVLA